MKVWKCPSCKKERCFQEQDKLIMRVCYTCQIRMEVKEDGKQVGYKITR